MALAAAIAATAAALVGASRPTEAERTEARGAACLMFVLSIFGGPDLTAAALGKTDAFDGDGDEQRPTLADIDAAGPAFADPLHEIVAVGAVLARDGEPSTEQADRYWGDGGTAGGRGSWRAE